ncbi:flagellar hook-length control protein FliK [Desulfosporosinus acididurans]|uniref:Flagellar hook-length control protein FliK n=1 Tax=Desulfosporosinus acididurans TaxID=476652 RepID=A0A0J1FQ06_9FIRM|nr:flagellar hook-length control protein FliK [Desulfosporosinus acididurans]KLU65033.1 flagellar hook-length control protein FliK [Desulfosporosinus acididurans]
MASIDVLSEVPKGGSKTGNASTTKGKTAADSSGNAASAFAQMLNGQIQSKSAADTKGQSSGASHDAQEKQNSQNSKHISENTSNEQGSVMGYANLALSFLAQMRLQNKFPAGKEANSGNEASLEAGNSLTVNSSMSKGSLLDGKNQELALVNLLSQSSDEVSSQLGTTMVKSQGGNPAISELDNYKQVIADLLKELSGKITDISGKSTASISGIDLKNVDAKSNQDLAKIIQGWLMDVNGQQVSQESSAGLTIGVGKDNASTLDLNTFLQGILGFLQDEGEKGNQNTDLYAKLDSSVTGSNENKSVQDSKTSLLTTLSNLLSEENKGAEDTVLSSKTEGLVAGFDKNSFVSSAKSFLQTFLNSLAGNGGESSKDAALLTKVKGILNKELINETGTKSNEPSEVKAMQNQDQNPLLNIGLTNNITAANVTDGKTTAIPVYQQISAAVSEQLMNKPQVLKQLDIQLQPADLGKIQIDLRWENGQVHLQVQASQAATGQLLQNQLPDLRQALENQGINCGMLQMGMGGKDQRNSHGNESSQTRQPKINVAEDEDIIPAHKISVFEEDGSNQINVTA